MIINEQVCSLELAKQLKELGLKQESLFYRFDHGNHQYLFCKHYEQYSPHVNLNINDGFSAYTSSELMELLPQRIITKDKPPFNSFVVRITKSLVVSNKINEKEIETIFYPDASPIYVINYYCDSTEITGEDAWLQRGLLEHNIWGINFCNVLAKTLIELYNLGLLIKEHRE